MEILGHAKKVTIYIGESDRWEGKPLYVAILEMLKAEDCAGATVTRALAGFGAHSRIHTARLVDLSADLPTIQLADSRAVRPGEWVMALGHPWGVTGAATAGVVIGMGREWPEMPPAI